MRFLNDQPAHDLTYSDVFLAPNRSSVASRTEVDLTSTDGLETPLPVVVANMTAISGRRMAETVARRGGIAVLPQDIPTDVVSTQISRVKQAHPVFETPIQVAPGTTVGEAMALIPKRAHGVALVVADGRPLGLVSPDEAAGVDRFTQVQDQMTTDIAVVSETTSPAEVFDTLRARHQKVAVVVDGDGCLVGLMTSKGALRSSLYQPALDPGGRLRVGTAVGINGDVGARSRRLLEAGSDVLVVDTAHGHSRGVIERVREIKRHYPDLQVVAGNIATAEAARIMRTNRQAVEAMCRTGLLPAYQLPDNGHWRIRRTGFDTIRARLNHGRTAPEPTTAAVPRSHRSRRRSRTTNKTTPAPVSNAGA